jgi:hypothetical protein
MSAKNLFEQRFGFQSDDHASERLPAEARRILERRTQRSPSEKEVSDYGIDR